jgi:predicted AlkP superfamily phosphohydrolase/phosphomutase
MADKILIIGLDGADWRVLQPFIDAGDMPNLASLLATGVSGQLCSTIPTNSSVAWSTFLTGRNPGKHGIFGFAQRAPHDLYRMVAVNSRSLRTETFLETLSRHGRRVGAINIPTTYPPFPVNGFMLGGMIVQKGRPYTYPESLARELDDRVGGYPVNRIRWRLMSGQLERLLDEAIAVTEQRAKVLEYLVDYKDWDVLIQVFVGMDRLQHPLMHVLDSRHPRYDTDLARRLRSKLRAFFQVIDDTLGSARQRIDQDTVLMVISDHGFRSVHKEIHVREILAKHGFLCARKRHIRVNRRVRKTLRRVMPISTKTFLSNKRRVGSPKQMADLIWAQTRAYTTARNSQGVHVNLSGREPKGIVARGAPYERLLKDIQESLCAERDPANGQTIIETVTRSDELFNGPWLNLAPDLLLVPAPGYAFARGATGHLQPYEWRSGDHDLHGIFVAAGPGLKRGAKVVCASLSDLAPTALYMTGIPITEDMDGKVLDIFADERLTTAPPTYEPNADPHHVHTYFHTAEEERFIEEQLRSLGYL